MQHRRQANLRGARDNVARQRLHPAIGATRRARAVARRGAAAPRCPAGTAGARVPRHAEAAVCAAARACSPSTSPHTTPPEPQRQISSIKISSWKASNPCAVPTRRRSACYMATSQRPNRLGRFTAPRRARTSGAGPAYAAGQGGPTTPGRRPAAKALAKSSRGIALARSHVSQCGVTSASTNARTLSRNARWLAV